MDNLITAFYDLLVAISGLFDFIKSFFSSFRAYLECYPPKSDRNFEKFQKKTKNFICRMIFTFWNIILDWLLVRSLTVTHLNEIESFFQKRKNGFG